MAFRISPPSTAMSSMPARLPAFGAGRAAGAAGLAARAVPVAGALGGAAVDAASLPPESLAGEWPGRRDGAPSPGVVPAVAVALTGLPVLEPPSALPAPPPALE